jgi:two-component system chemotaxis response regulator CheB
LNQSSRLPVELAIDGRHMAPGRAYVAPDGLQMQVSPGDRITLSEDVPENGQRPSVSSLFRSVARVYGRTAAGVLLTGMGKDGAEELKALLDKGGITIAQNRESSVVFGMPGEAVRICEICEICGFWQCFSSPPPPSPRR